MKTIAMTVALLMSGAAIAQTSTTTTTTTQPELDLDADVGVQPDGDLDVDADVDLQNETTTTTHTAHPTGTTTTTHTTEMPATTAPTGTWSNTTTTVAMAPASPPVVQPANTNPEEDARGITVMSDPAHVPVGFNGIAGAAVGGPEEASYPACSASVTDNCVQAYERGVR